jgi:APA family basic amino acid/polyamine antiporter
MLISALTVAAVYVVRRAADDNPKSNFSVPGYPYTPAIYILLVIFSWIQTLQKQPMPAIYAIVTIAAGVAVYYVGRMRGWIDTSSVTRSKTETKETDQ